MVLLLLIYILLALLLASMISGMVIPRILKHSIRKRESDQQDYRKLHSGFASRLGGLSFLPTLLCTSALAVVAFGVHSSFYQSDIYDATNGYNIVVSWDAILERCFNWQMFSLLIGAVVIYIVGFVDDTKGLGYKVKLLTQFLVAALLIWAGFYIDGVQWEVMQSLPVAFWYILSAFVIVLVIDAFNLIDGIDGLASGISIVASSYFGFHFWLLCDWLFAIMAFALLGTIIPFFFFNTYNKHTKHHIFMGDTGSMTLGIVFVAFALQLCQDFKFALPECGDACLIYGFVPLLVPCLDVVRVFLYRIRHRVSPFEPDRNHIHHKLMKISGSQTRARRIILLSSVLYIVGNLLVLSFVGCDSWTVLWLSVVDAAIYAVWNVYLSWRIKTLAVNTVNSSNSR